YRNPARNLGRLLVPLTLFLFRHQRRALVVIVVSHLTIQAVVTFIGIDRPVGMNGLNLTLHRTELAGTATLFTPFEPVEQPELGRNGQRSSQRADVPAVNLAGENIDDQQNDRVEHEPPLAVELQRNGGFERLDLGKLLRGRHGLQGNAKQHQQNDVFHGPQTLVQREGQFILGNFQFAGGFINKLLQGTERTQPTKIGRDTSELQSRENL